MRARALSHTIQHVYRDRGDPRDRVFESTGAAPPLGGLPTPFAITPVAQIMSRDLICAHPALATEVLAELLVRDRIGCVPVVDKHGRPVGLITKRDLVEQLLAVGPVGTDTPTTRSLLPRTAMELMLPVAITLAEDATVEEAATVMTREAVHHLGIVDADGRLVGVVSALDIVRGLAVPEPDRPELSA